MTYKILVQILIIYFFATIIVYLLSDFSIFVPPRSTYKDSANIIKIQTSTGKHISAIYIPNPTSKYVVIYSHGNAEDLGVLYPFLQMLHNWGLSVIGYDYEGYGTSEGKPSEKATYADIDAVYEYLITQQHVQPQNIIVFGSSLGSGPSIELAMHKPIGGIILEGAFVSAYRVVTRYPIFLFDKYKNLNKLRTIVVPILFIHGVDDEVIPFWHGQKLYAAYNGPKEYYWIENTGHNNIDFNNPQYKKAILHFIAGLHI